MHAPYAAQYCVIGGSGAGSGGNFTLEAAAICAALAAAVSEALFSALVADAAVAVLPAVVALAAMGVEAPFTVAAVAAVVAAGALASGAAAAGMLAPIGADEKVLGGNGGRDGTPVDVVLVAAGLRGGICDSRTMLTLVLFAAA
jgi:hypothetical protein